MSHVGMSTWDSCEEVILLLLVNSIIGAVRWHKTDAALEVFGTQRLDLENDLRIYMY